MKSGLRTAAAKRCSLQSDATVQSLVSNYGTEYDQVMKLVDAEPALGEPIGDSPTIRAQVLYAVDQEMARTLGDVVFRRTDLATGECPSVPVLHECADLMARRLNWPATRVQQEIESVSARFPAVFASPSTAACSS